MMHQVLIDSYSCGEEWGYTGYWWLQGRPELCRTEPPFEWLVQHAVGQWDWSAVGDPGEPHEAPLTQENFGLFEGFYFVFNFALARDAVLFKLVWN